jgi:hypothetical protein
MSSEEAQAAALAQAEKLIPSIVRMISGCRDEQTSADGTFLFYLSLVLFVEHGSIRDRARERERERSE